MKCLNDYCLHSGKFNRLASWNDTNCGMWEIDPYDEKDNTTGFKVEDCDAREKYEGKIKSLIDYGSLKPGDTFFIPNETNAKNCNVIYNNVKKRGLKVVLKKQPNGLLATISS